MKIDTRVSGPSPSASGPAISGGGSTSAIIVIIPSAGAMISPSPLGVVRIGSRKKAATHKVTAASGQAIVSQLNKAKTRHRAAEITTNLRPSGCTFGIRYRTLVVTRSGFSSEVIRRLYADRPVRTTVPEPRLIDPRSGPTARPTSNPARKHRIDGQDQSENAARRTRRGRDDTHHMAVDP